ncbi:MAG TPA: S46 family peptidase [Gemmatimonadetes bacterium]|nr:S46 family peptidase [Gemmatimonadota bacterium]
MVSRWQFRAYSRELHSAITLLLFTGCGGPQVAPPPAPVPEGPQNSPEVMQIPMPDESTLQNQVLGINFDTVQAGAFDQGKMWTFEFPPVDYIADVYGFRPDAEWFERARLGALRIPSCSASFVSPHGLVMTNHHCAREFVSQVSGDGEALLDEGFVAKDLVDERMVEDFEADQLIEIVDVTDEVNAQLDVLPQEERASARAELLEEIEGRILEQRGGEDSGHEIEMISLYNGARTSAYVFRRYTNAKLVMAPELQIGFFGGDPDNFTYPRYNMDFSFFRLYDEDGSPLSSDTYFPFDRDGLSEGDPIFIVGNPGSTSRLQTVAELEYRRDVSDRFLLETVRKRMAVLDVYIRENPEIAEQYDLRNQYFSLSNTEKAYEGQLHGLGDPVILAKRADTEADFREAINADPTLQDLYGGLVDRMAELQELKRNHTDVVAAFSVFGNPILDSSTLIRGFWGLQVISMQQGGAPAEALESMIDNVRGTPQVPAELDIALMADRFRDLIEHLGADHPAVMSLLAGRTPETVAERVVSNSMLSDSAGAVAALESGGITRQDPAVQAVTAFLPAFLELNSLFAEVAPEEEVIASELGRARFKIYGTEVPPDATFSLRIADGFVSGYEYNGTIAPVFTTLFGLYDRHYSHSGKEDWALPERWMDPPSSLDLSTPVNFVSTADIIGGNSGSPVLDRDLEVVGLVFDGNIESLSGDYIYLPEKNRSVSVDVRVILEALDEIYDLDRLVLELTTGRLFETEEEADQVGR